jgi:hydroxypyruvate isomerase
VHPRHSYSFDYCAGIVRRVDSPRVKLLFDIYHVAIMNGDVIRRLRQYRDWIGHVHAAGVPGRGELNVQQIGYEGFAGPEFIPTRDPAEGLAEAVAWCDE